MLRAQESGRVRTHEGRERAREPRVTSRHSKDTKIVEWHVLVGEEKEWLVRDMRRMRKVGDDHGVARLAPRARVIGVNLILAFHHLHVLKIK